MLIIQSCVALAALAAPFAIASPVEEGLSTTDLVERGMDAPTTGLSKRSTQLADGRYMQAGSFTNTFRWQASGKLATGGCLKQYGITDYYSLYLASWGNLESTKSASASSSTSNSNVYGVSALSSSQSLEDLAAEDDEDLDAYYRAFPDQRLSKRQVVRNCTDPNPGPPKPAAPRQRIELFSWPGAAAGQTWTYKWKSRHLATSTNNHFHHIWQLLRRDACGGYVVALDLKDNKAVISDTVRGCKDCARIGAPQWLGQTVSHTLTVKYGISGSLNYVATNVANKKTLLTYKIARGDMGASGSIKFGSYRWQGGIPQLRPVNAFVGDYSAKRVS